MPKAAEKAPMEEKISFTSPIMPSISGYMKMQMATKAPIEIVHMREDLIPLFSSRI